MRTVLKKSLGIIFIILGFVALITPFSPGSWLILVGLEILGIRLLVERKISFFLKEKHRKKRDCSIFTEFLSILLFAFGLFCCDAASLLSNLA
jgi:uncharacterized membrane protein